MIYKYFAFITAFFLPIIICGLYTHDMEWSTQKLGSLSIGIILGIINLKLMLFLLTKKRKEIQLPQKNHDNSYQMMGQEQNYYARQVKHLEQALSQHETLIENLQTESLQKQNAVEILQEENESLKVRKENLSREFTVFRQEAKNKLQNKDEQLQEQQQIIEEQKTQLSINQDQLTKQQKQILSLSNEINEILQLGNDNSQQKLSSESYHPVVNFFQTTKEQPPNYLNDSHIEFSKNKHSHYDILNQLQKYLEKIQQLTGIINSENNSFNFTAPPKETYLDELNRLFNNQTDSTNTIFIYSPNHKQLLFINNQVKYLLGWETNYVIKNFHKLIHKGSNDWERTIKKLNLNQDALINLTMHAKDKKLININSYLSIIPTGLFKEDLIGILSHDLSLKT